MIGFVLAGAGSGSFECRAWNAVTERAELQSVPVLAAGGAVLVDRVARLEPAAVAHRRVPLESRGAPGALGDVCARRRTRLARVLHQTSSSATRSLLLSPVMSRIRIAFGVCETRSFLLFRFTRQWRTCASASRATRPAARSRTRRPPTPSSCGCAASCSTHMHLRMTARLTRGRSLVTVAAAGAQTCAAARAPRHTSRRTCARRLTRRSAPGSCSRGARTPLAHSLSLSLICVRATRSTLCLYKVSLVAALAYSTNSALRVRRSQREPLEGRVGRVGARGQPAHDPLLRARRPLRACRLPARRRRHRLWLVPSRRALRRSNSTAT